MFCNYLGLCSVRIDIAPQTCPDLILRSDVMPVINSKKKYEKLAFVSFSKIRRALLFHVGVPLHRTTTKCAEPFNFFCSLNLSLFDVPVAVVIVVYLIKLPIRSVCFRRVGEGGGGGLRM